MKDFMTQDEQFLDPREVLRIALDKHHPNIALACSFQAENVVLIDMLMSINREARLFSLDTGRLPAETYEVAEELRKRYGLKIEWHFPDREAVEQLIRAKGLYSFRESVENRKECCHIRKVVPLKRALEGLTAWISGLRREHAETRSRITQFSIDAANGGIEKICPLVHWSTKDVWDYIRKRNLPYNRLYDRGYLSIGCEPCTSPVLPGEDERAGRWRWEQFEHKECGLHSAGSGI